MATARKVEWGECYNAAGQLLQRWQRSNIKFLYGVPRGGCLAALLVQSLAHRDGLEWIVVDEPVPGETLVVDDIIDSGKTLAWYHRRNYPVDALFRAAGCKSPLAPSGMKAEGWLTFPWETADGGDGTGAEDSIIRLLQFIGEDVQRDGLRETPTRVLKAWQEMTAGYRMDPAAILNRCFEQPHDELVLLRGVEFYSTCEHHLLPFYGTAAVGYIPTEKVVGISKLARLVDCFARRLQIQERLTQQIAETIHTVLQPTGVGVVLKAKHACMGCRGVMKADADMVTSVMLGALRDKSAARSEFLSLVTL